MSTKDQSISHSNANALADQEAPTELSRRGFLRIMFATAPAISLLANLPVSARTSTPQPEWPKEREDLPRHDPVIIEMDESGYLIDPEFEDPELPTVGQYYKVEEMDDEQRIDFYDDHYNPGNYDVVANALGIDVAELDELKPEHLDILDAYYASWLEEPMEDFGSFYQNAINSEYWVGNELLEALGNEQGAELGLRLIEGDCPGSSFCGVRFAGDVDALNAQLYQYGVNARVLQT